ncbi:MAG: hypothetical protein HZA91_19000, partial [Verrucomicrobia bacterium]|nr:hypothetical protein [Verrucomicrobiota bacterium]
IPMKPDPPPALDGQLEDWSNVPGALLLNRREQATWGGGAWKSASDLSAKVWLAWRQDMLYLAADVTDDKIRQTERGAGIWKGDSIQLLLDVAPDEETARGHFGKGQFQIAFSPGNFQRTGYSLNDCPPEAYCFRPEGFVLKGALVAAQQTERGYTLEAAIPWPLLGVRQPAAGMPVSFEIAVFDSDGTEARSEKLLSFSTQPWNHSRPRLNRAALAGSDGKAPAVVRGTPVFETLTLKPGEKQTFKFSSAKPPAGKDAVISLKARLDHPKVAGFNYALRLTLNGTALDGRRLLNKPLKGKGADGRIHSLVSGESFATYFTPDFTAADRSQYGIRDVKTGEFELRVTDLLREGDNELVIANVALPGATRVLMAAGGKLAFAAPPPPPKPKAGPPKGAIPACAPVKEPKTACDARELPDAKLTIEVSGEKFSIESRFSTPAGKWERGSNPFFEHSRRVERKAEAIVVRDTFKNLTAENLPLMQRHEATWMVGRDSGEPPSSNIASSAKKRLDGVSPHPEVASPRKKIWLAGISPAGLIGTSSAPENPTTFGVTEKSGLGLLPLNDEFQVHVSNYAADGALGLADNQFVLQPGKSYTAEWAIVPVAQPDNFDFINAARRLLDANFTIPYCYAFLRGGPHTEKWSDEQFANFIKLKSANLMCDSIMYPTWHGHYTHGTPFQLVSHDSYKRYVERIRRLVPDAKSCIYFHCFIDTLEDAPEKYPDARVLRSDGTQADYGKAADRIFFPTERNGFGRAMRRNVEIILDDIKADGVYWDELEYSAYAYHYGEPWDGCSADIDAKTMKIRRLKSSVTLLSQPWRVALIKEIMARGPFIANGQPHTRTVARLKFPRFCETGSISNCARAQLHSPIALGDHLTERSEEDAYRNMVAALDYGCVSHWYSDLQVMPTFETITKFMYPITPLELHEGYIIAKERILTNCSGLFGWDDVSRHEVHIFDDTGREVPGFKAPTVERDGAMFTELRIAEGWSAAIVRR